MHITSIQEIENSTQNPMATHLSVTRREANRATATAILDIGWRGYPTENSVRLTIEDKKLGTSSWRALVAPESEGRFTDHSAPQR